MSDLISRQDAIDAMATWDWQEMYLPIHFKQLLEDLPSAQQWIPCSERLPYSQEDVLCDDDGRVTIGYYTDEEVGWHDTHSYRIYPTAWMPLPEPYERRKEKYDKEKEKA